jgi:hypothetical protein
MKTPKIKEFALSSWAIDHRTGDLCYHDYLFDIGNQFLFLDAQRNLPRNQ